MKNAKVTASLLTLLAPTVATHAASGIQIGDTSIWGDTEIVKTAPVKPSAEVPVKHTDNSNLGKKILCTATKDGKVISAESLTEVLRQIGYTREPWGKSDRLAWAWYRINGNKFKRGEAVELDGWTFQKI